LSLTNIRLKKGIKVKGKDREDAGNNLAVKKNASGRVQQYDATGPRRLRSGPVSPKPSGMPGRGREKKGGVLSGKGNEKVFRRGEATGIREKTIRDTISKYLRRKGDEYTAGVRRGDAE